VLAILAEQRHVIRDLTANAERVLTRLAANRDDVTRFTAEARDTSAATAERADDLARQFNRFPTFLRELRPTMASLEQSADAQIPALRNLNANAEELEAFFKALAPFSDASRPATRALASAARAGRPAMRSARPRIRELRSFAGPLPEVTRNLTFVLEDLDDRGRAVEKDPRSPGGQGYTGIEAILQYVFNQSQAINFFDNNSYILKVSAFFDRACADYTDAEEAKNPAMDRCAAILGPSRPAINQPDPSDQVAGQQRSAERVEARRDAEALDAARRAAGSTPAGGDGPSRQGPAPARGPGVAEAVEGLLGGRLPDVRLPQGAPPLPSPTGEPLRGDSAAGLLDYLLGS
jgi:ABC-type transporter Mla subunit MlaD